MSLRTAFSSPDAKRRYVRRLFTTIADRYDLITRVLSFGRDRRWKARLLALARPAPGEAVLDLACGTGDLALAMAGRVGRVVGLDLTPRMVELASAKPGQVEFLVGDMGALPLGDRAFDLVTTGYGLRNVGVLESALREAHRVLRPGGRLVSLDFDRPRSWLVRTAYLAYLTVVGSCLGVLLHGDPDTYPYIPASIRRYPGANGVADRMRAIGFREVEVYPVLGGLMAIHRAVK